MRIRIIKQPPAPLLDGFDVRGLRAHQIYDVDIRVGNYLLIAGYAVVASDDESEPSDTPTR